jgi:pyrroline-5-carboxylate reductase
MFDKTLGFIGGGRIVRILLCGWQRAGVTFPAVVVSDTNADALQRLSTLSTRLQAIAGDNAAAAGQDIVFVAVHPPAIAEALSAVAGQLRPQAIVVSLAPKWTMERLAERLGGFSRIARMIPNAPARIGRGFNPIAWSDTLNDADRDAIRRLMAPLGDLPETPEDTLEAYAILSAMGPTYFWPQWIELESLAVEFGLQPEQARQAIRAMTVGALEMLAAAELPPAEVLDSIPAKPLADFEPELRAAYRSRLTALFVKIRP